jgi:hypothetical protein
MAMTLTDADRTLMTRYFESVLIRFKEGRYNLATAAGELAQTFALAAAGQSEFRTQMLGVTEAGDDA